MVQQPLKVVQKILKENASAIIFFGIIAFAFTSLVVNYRTEQQQIAMLVDYVEQSTPFIIDGVSAISSLSLIQTNILDNYTMIITKVENLLQQVNDRINTIPTTPRTDVRVTTLIEDLKSLLTYVQSRLQFIINRLEVVKELLPAFETLRTFDTVIALNDVDGLNNVRHALSMVSAERSKMPFEVTLYLDTTFFPQYAALQEALQQNSQVESTPDWADLKAKTKNITVPNFGFAIIRRDDVLTPEFYDNVERAKQSLDSIKIAYGL